MPNHITNELSAEPHVLRSLRGDESAVDFNSVIPMPELLLAESSSPMIEDWARIVLGITTPHQLLAGGALERLMSVSLQFGPYPKDFSDQEFEELVKYMRCLRLYGHASWYQWSLENWGTKWNAYDIRQVDDRLVQFSTAWSAPLPVISELSRRHADEDIRLRWADENFGYNAGDLVMRGGEVISGGQLPDDSPESHALACELVWGGTVVDEYRFDESTQKYVYQEEG